MQLKMTHLIGRSRPFAKVLATTRRAGVAAVAMVALAAPVAAQNLFAPALTVNDDVITNYELVQRTNFLTILRAPGDPAELARQQLIDDRLRNQVTTEAGIEVTPEQVKAGVEEFASRTNLSAEALLQAVGQEGIAPETVRDFVRGSLAWRQYVRDKYINQARPSRAEIDRAVAQGPQPGVRVLLSEVIIPITPETADQVEALAREIAALRSYDAFSDAARQFSASDTRNNGGRLNWIALNTLPPQLQPLLIDMNPGDTTAPIPLPNAVAIFQMRGIQEIVPPTPSYSSIDYAAYYIPGGRSPEALARAAALRGQVDRCDDLYGIAQGQPESVLDRESRAPGQIPSDIALELSKLDVGEVSTALTRSNGQQLVFLMLCKRTAAVNADVTPEDVEAALTQRKLSVFAESELAQLRANALIVEQ